MLRSCQRQLTPTTNTRSVDLSWPDPTWPKCMNTSSVIKTKMIFPKTPIAATLNIVLSGPDFPRLLGHWPDLRGHHLTYHLKTGYRWLRLVTTYTMLFPRGSSSIRGRTRGGSHQPPPPVPSKDTKWPVPARVKRKSSFRWKTVIYRNGHRKTKAEKTFVLLKVNVSTWSSQKALYWFFIITLASNKHIPCHQQATHPFPCATTSSSSGSAPPGSTDTKCSSTIYTRFTPSLHCDNGLIICWLIKIPMAHRCRFFLNIFFTFISAKHWSPFLNY